MVHAADIVLHTYRRRFSIQHSNEIITDDISLKDGFIT